MFGSRRALYTDYGVTSITIVGPPAPYSATLSLVVWSECGSGSCALAAIVAHVLFNLLRPVRGRAHLLETIATMLERLRASCMATTNSAVLVALVETVAMGVPTLLLLTLLPGVMAAQLPLQILLPGRSHCPIVPSWCWS